MNLDSVIARVREELDSRRTHAEAMAARVAPPPPPRAPIEVGRLPREEPLADPQDRAGLLRLPPQAFIAAAYRILLGREVDPQGEAHYGGVLARAERTRLEVLLEIAASAEAAPSRLPQWLREERARRERAAKGGIMAWLRGDGPGPDATRELECRELAALERERRLAAQVDLLAAAFEDLQARSLEEAQLLRAALAALEEAKAPRDACAALAAQVASLHARVRDLDEGLDAAGREPARDG